MAKKKKKPRGKFLQGWVWNGKRPGQTTAFVAILTVRLYPDTAEDYPNEAAFYKGLPGGVPTRMTFMIGLLAVVAWSIHAASTFAVGE